MLSQPDAAEWRGIDDKTVEIFSVPWVSILVACCVIKPSFKCVFIRRYNGYNLGYNGFTKV